MSADSTSIHRLLDDAFDGVAMTADLKDLKEELRGNLASRVSELEAKGTDAATAATAAFAELGDIHELIAGVGAEASATRSTPVTEAAIAAARNRVRPKSGFVLRTVLLSIVITAGATVVALGAFGVIDWGLAGAALFAVAVGLLVADGLRQETSQHFPAPAPRAFGWGAASALFAAGAAAAVLLLAGVELWLLVVAVALALAGIAGWVWLGVTQTNRLKPWVLDQNRAWISEDRFSQDPVAAARFGMFTVVIWTLAITAFIVLSITIGFAWSWLAIVGGFVVFFLVLAKMLFPASAGK